MKTLALVLALSSLNVSAQDAAPATPQRGNGQHLNQVVQIESQSHQERIGILNRAELVLKQPKHRKLTKPVRLRKNRIEKHCATK